MPFGSDMPTLRTPIVGPESRAAVDRLAGLECPAITARRSRRAGILGQSDVDPIVWSRALGANVEDADGFALDADEAAFANSQIGQLGDEDFGFSRHAVAP